MTQNNKQACILGGTGFIGRQITRELARMGYVVRVATRAPEKAYFLKTYGNVGQVVPFACRYSDDSSLEAAVRGCEVVVNCIGILYEKSKNDFTKIHKELPARLAKVCNTQGVSRFIHLSALGCDTTKSSYGKSKKAGEEAVFENFPNATILRPSVVFGADDNFFNMFAKLSVVLPVLPLIGGGKTKFQPVCVDDVVGAFAACLKIPDSKGKVYELGGPEIINFRDIYARLFVHTGRKKILLNVPWSLAKIQGGVLQHLPNPLLTADQVESLKTDSIVRSGSLGLENLLVVPTYMDAVLPSYLSRYRPGGRFGNKKRA